MTKRKPVDQLKRVRRAPETESEPRDLLTRAEVEAAARKLYERQANGVVPKWDSLGDATRSVWRDYVRAGRRV